jgi:CTP-dependent riboflavin kinase
MADEEIRRRREARRRFLEILYDRSERGESEYQDGYDLAAEIGVSRQDAERIVRYHEDHGFIRKSGSHGLTVRITAQGIDHVEQGT